MMKSNNSFIKLFQKFCSMTKYGPEEVEPLDTPDPAVYMKIPRCYSGNQMDPWISATWSKKWDSPLHSQEGHQGQAQPNQPRKDL